MVMYDGYGLAAVCRRGHVASSDLRISRASGPRCVDCGAALLTNCPACSKPVRGEYFVAGVISVSSWSPNDFCDQCGAAFPWASLQARVWALENLLEESDLDEANRLRVRKLLAEVANEGEDFDVDREKKVWSRIRALWPGVSDKAWSIAGPLITAEAKRQMGLV
jgi:hypothetical protein